MSARAWAVAALFSLFPATTVAQDVASGPAADKPVPALPVFAATGTHEGKDVDVADDRKAKPTVYLFVRADQWDRPMARFVRGLDEGAGKGPKDAAVVAVWVGGDADTAKAYLPKAQQSLKLANTALAVFAGDKGGPAAWKLNADARVTAVVAAGGKVAWAGGFDSVNETDAAGVLAKLKKAAGGP